jgi:hypothetical protein
LARAEEQSTSCALSSIVRFRPGVTDGQARHVFIRFRIKLTGCAGGGVTSAQGSGGGVGKLRCTAGQAVAKAELDWDTGAKSFLNFQVDLGAGTLTGEVVDGLFKGEALSAGDISVTPIRGDCVTSPLKKAKLTATVGL